VHGSLCYLLVCFFDFKEVGLAICEIVYNVSIFTLALILMKYYDLFPKIEWCELQGFGTDILCYLKFAIPATVLMWVDFFNY
jgi:hypothetical protein